MLEHASSKEQSQQPTALQKSIWDDDELPDLYTEEGTVALTGQKSCDSNGPASENEANAVAMDREAELTEENLEEDFESKDKESRKAGHDSGYLTVPSNNNSSEENSSDNSRSGTPIPAEKESVQSDKTVEETSAPARPSTTQLTPRLAGLQADSVQPRLSAGPGDFHRLWRRSCGDSQTQWHQAAAREAGGAFTQPAQERKNCSDKVCGLFKFVFS